MSTPYISQATVEAIRRVAAPAEVKVNVSERHMGVPAIMRIDIRRPEAYRSWVEIIGYKCPTLAVREWSVNSPEDLRIVDQILDAVQTESRGADTLIGIFGQPPAGWLVAAGGVGLCYRPAPAGAR